VNKKSKILPTKKEQIESLIDLHNTKHELAQKYNIETWEELFTVTKSEILSYIKSNYSLRDLGMYDKKCYLNLKKEGEKYIIYTWDYEYEMRTGEVIGMTEEYYDSEDEVYEQYVKFITRSSGTGLTFEDKE
jgi:hypothetical protein